MMKYGTKVHTKVPPLREIITAISWYVICNLSMEVRGRLGKPEQVSSKGYDIHSDFVFATSD